MTPSLRVLLVEDSEDDALLILRALRRGGLEPTALRVQDAKQLAVALAQPWDVVISDFSMQGFTGMDALAMCRATHADIPFILMSGTIGEETAVAAMKAGANDYVMKHNMARLAPALLRELHEATMRADLRRTELKLIESERRFHAFMDASPFIASIKDDSGRYVYRNQGWNKIFGLDGPVWLDDDGEQLPHERRAAARASDIEVLTRGV
ncbi:MAG: response regulator, partial [Herminiimonas sp.]|nr:response regulator [Herminiimonas sp.]